MNRKTLASLLKLRSFQLRRSSFLQKPLDNAMRVGVRVWCK